MSDSEDVAVAAAAIIIAVHEEEIEKADFETAVSATKFGKYNYLLLLASISCAMAPIVDNTVMSYVISAAQCDLSLSLREKGTLNSAVFIGYVLSSHLWGFLGDTLGRRRMLFLAYVLDLIFNVLGAFMQNFWLQYIFKFLAGFAVSGPYALIITYMSEFHSSKYRSKVVLIVGMSMVSSLLFLSGLAWVVIPLPNIPLWNYVLHSWQLFLLFSSIPVAISALLFAFLPESPKFLMSTGRNEAAMKIFRQIYSWNTGEQEEKYPIKSLNDEAQSSNATHINQILNKDNIAKDNIFKMLQIGLMQVKPLFQQPYLINICKVIVIHFGILLGANTLRLWLPQIFTTIDEFNKIHGSDNGTLCEVIEFTFRKNNVTNLNITEKIETDCVPVLKSNQVYLNGVILSSAAILFCLFCIIMINRFQKKYFLVVIVTISGCAALGIFWTPNQRLLLAVSTINIILALNSSTILMSLVVEVFPTSLRGVAVALTITAGQLGAVCGNIIFPYLLQLGCFPPFLFLGSIIFTCGLLCLTLPKPSKEDFK